MDICPSLRIDIMISIVTFSSQRSLIERVVSAKVMMMAKMMEMIVTLMMEMIVILMMEMIVILMMIMY